MKFLLIYGSPAAGKLTVANEIAAQTGFKVFHNHLTINCVRPIFDFGTPPFGRLIDAFRLQLISEAARENVDLVHTFVYSFGNDDPYVERVTAAVEENGGEVCLVLLKCDMEELFRRVTAESREKAGKVVTPETLRSLHEVPEMTLPYPKRESLVIDNTWISYSDTAERIIDHFGFVRL